MTAAQIARELCPGSVHGEVGAIPCVCDQVAMAIVEARNGGWRAACTEVAYAINVRSMCPARPVAQDLDNASMAVVRGRRVVTEVSRRGAPA